MYLDWVGIWVGPKSIWIRAGIRAENRTSQSLYDAVQYTGQGLGSRVCVMAKGGVRSRSKSVFLPKTRN